MPSVLAPADLMIRRRQPATRAPGARTLLLAALVATPALAAVPVLPAAAGAQAPSRPASAAPPTFASDTVSVTPALARETFEAAWSRIGTTYYDSAMGGLDWNAVRRDLLPRAEQASNLAQLRGVLGELASRLGESHFGIIPYDAAQLTESAATDGEGAPGDAGLSVRLLDGSVVVSSVAADGPAQRAGARPGWIVEMVDGDSVAPLLRNLDRLADAAQRHEAELRLPMFVERQLTGAAGSPVTVVFRDGGGQRVERALVRRPVPGVMVKFGNLPPLAAQVRAERRVQPDGSCIGVLHWNTWMLPLVQEIQRGVDSLRACRGIVLDLRGNLGGVGGMVMVVAGQFLEEEAPMGVFRSRGTELRFRANPRRVNADGSRASPYTGPVALLVDELSASTSEFFAAGMQQAGRARLFGGTTAGMALPAGIWKLPTGDVLMHVIADFTAPDGTRIEGRGVTPDVPVPLERQALLAGRDAALEEALAWVTQASSPRP